MLNPCARESKARTGRFLREKLISDHGLFSSYEDQQGSANGSCGFSRYAQGFRRLDTGSRAGFTSLRPPPPVFQFFLFMYNVCHTYSKGMDQPGKVARPARGQLNRKNDYFPVRVRA